MSTEAQRHAAELAQEVQQLESEGEAARAAENRENTMTKDLRKAAA